MLFISSSVQACSDFFSEKQKAIIETVISKETQKSEDIINSKHTETVFQISQRNEGFSIGIRKNASNFDVNPNHFFNVIPPQIVSLLNYIYTLSYLENISKVIFSILFNEILPNAP